MLKKNLAIIAGLILASNVQSQNTLSKDDLVGQRNVITTAVPFLTITPDSRSAGMGDAGVARDPDANSIHWNIASMAFIDKKAGLSLNAAPWLRQLVPDVWFYHLAGYSKVGRGDKSAIAASIRYFSLGEIQFTDDFGNPNGNANPYELAVDLGYSTQLSENLSVGIAMRFINSCLTCGSTGTAGNAFKPGRAAAGDIGVYYKKPLKPRVDWAFGAAITNIGNKITYSTEQERDFIPANLRIGTSFNTKLDEHNELNINLDINKLLVPTYPVYYKASDGTDSIDQSGNKVVQYGKDSKDVPVITGMFRSFGDAPGGFKEELKEYNIAAGLEYWYDKQFAVRAGYFNEANTKGGRKYVTFGIGLRYKVFGIDAAYLQPFTQRHPLQNTIRFSLLFDIDAFKKQSEQSKP
ncbi:MAG: type IX secretion system outer membrane channel protein PorV [Flavobacteriales bacterium]|nr:type IX secretion system outer membrane channel protein PorV [Flavobacteriales bacterium]